MVAHFTMRKYGLNQDFDLLKAYDYIERVVASDFFFRKSPFLHHTCATCSEQPSHIKTMIYTHIKMLLLQRDSALKLCTK